MNERTFLQQLFLLQQDIASTPALHPFDAQRREEWSKRLSDLMNRRLAAKEKETKLLQLFMCVHCVEEHGPNPQSVSCYCKCHNSVRDKERWPSIRAEITEAVR